MGPGDQGYGFSVPNKGKAIVDALVALISGGGSLVLALLFIKDPGGAFGALLIAIIAGFFAVGATVAAKRDWQGAAVVTASERGLLVPRFVGGYSRFPWEDIERFDAGTYRGASEGGIGWARSSRSTR